MSTFEDLILIHESKMCFAIFSSQQSWHYSQSHRQARQELLCWHWVKQQSALFWLLIGCFFCLLTNQVKSMLRWVFIDGSSHHFELIFSQIVKENVLVAPSFATLCNQTCQKNWIFFFTFWHDRSHLKLSNFFSELKINLTFNFLWVFF